MGDSDIPINRRKVIKTASTAIGVGALSQSASAVPNATRKRKRGRPSDVVQQVRHDDGFRALRKRLVRNHVIPKLNGAAVSDHERGKLITIPTMSPGRHDMGATIQAGVQDNGDVFTFTDVSGDPGRELDVSSPATLKALDDGLYSAHVAASPEEFRERTDPQPTQADDGGISIQSHLSDKVGFAWHYDSTFNEDTICDIFGGVDALIAVGALLANDITGIGTIDDVLIPAIGAVAGSCQIEDLAEEYLSGYLNCESYTWVYEVYLSDWWNPLGPIIVPTCK